MSSSMSFPSAATAAPAVRRRVLKRFQVLQRDRARLEQIGDEHPGRAVEEIEQVADEAAAVFAPVDRRLEELRVPDLLDLAQRALELQAVDERLDRRIGDALVVGEALEDLAHGGRSQLPELLENPGFGFGEARGLHRLLLVSVTLLQDT